MVPVKARNVVCPFYPFIHLLSLSLILSSSPSDFLSVFYSSSVTFFGTASRGLFFLFYVHLVLLKAIVLSLFFVLPPLPLLDLLFLISQKKDLLFLSFFVGLTDLVVEEGMSGACSPTPSSAFFCCRSGAFSLRCPRSVLHIIAIASSLC
jgi:hypothetical protein